MNPRVAPQLRDLLLMEYGCLVVATASGLDGLLLVLRDAMVDPVTELVTAGASGANAGSLVQKRHGRLRVLDDVQRLLVMI